MDRHTQRAAAIAEDGFAQTLGAQLVEIGDDRAVVKMQYKPMLGVGRVHGGAISALVDIAATVAFWSHPTVSTTARGATIGFTINYLSMAVATDLTATAAVRRRGGSICTGDVSVRDNAGTEVATAIVTYKMDPSG